jgi:excisionase family DNA binding protein
VIATIGALERHMVEEDLLTVNEVAVLCRVTTRTVRAWIAAGKLKATRILGRVRIKRRELQKLMK